MPVGDQEGEIDPHLAHYVQRLLRRRSRPEVRQLVGSGCLQYLANHLSWRAIGEDDVSLFERFGPFAQADSLASRPFEDAGQPAHQRGGFLPVFWHAIDLPESRGDGPRLWKTHSVSFGELRGRQAI